MSDLTASPPNPLVNQNSINLLAVLSIHLLATGVSETRAVENVPLYSDCRFWAGSTPEDLKLRQKKMKRKHRVFYFWDTKKKECLPCSRCRQSLGMKTLVACKYFRDTVCVNETAWNSRVYERTRADYAQDYEDGGLGAVGEDEDEAVMVYSEKQPSPVTQGPDVWGSWSDRRDGGRTESPTLQLARSTNNNNNNFKNSPGSYSEYGKPMFYSPEQKLENSVERPERPIVDVIREFLESNVSNAGNLRDVKKLPPRHYGPTLAPPPPLSPPSQLTLSPLQRMITTSIFLMTTTPRQSQRRRKPERKERVSSNLQENRNNFKRTNWSQRQENGNKQTNFIITESPVNYADGDDGDGDVGEEEEEDNDDFGITHNEIEVTTRSAGEKAFEKIRHLIQQEADQPPLHPLQLTLLLASVVAGVLLLVLIGILAVNKYRASRFKLLNNADTTYHSMSPFHTTAPVQALESSSLVGEEVISVHPAIVRSLKNIRAAGEGRGSEPPSQQSRKPVRQESLQSRMSSRQDSVESRSTLHSTIIDDRVRSIDDRPAASTRSIDDRPAASTRSMDDRPVIVVSPQSCIVDERGRTVLKP